MTRAHAATIAGCGVFVLLMSVMHVVRRDVSPLQRGISRYAGGDTLVLATVAFVALAVALLGLAVQRSHRRHGSAYALNAAAGGVALVLLTPIGGPSPSDAALIVHTLGGGLFYLGMAWAMWRGTRHRTLTWMFLVSLTLFFFAGLAAPGVGNATGLLQRVVFAIGVTWMVRTARETFTEQR